MGELIELDKHRPHLVIEATCGYCDHWWTAVIPTTAKKIQCPGCLKTNKLELVEGGKHG
jgi:hypothetical protein